LSSYQKKNLVCPPKKALPLFKLQKKVYAYRQCYYYSAKKAKGISGNLRARQKDYLQDWV